MPINFLDILILLCLLQGFLFAGIVFTTRFFHGKHNRLLAASIFMVSMIGLDEWLTQFDLDDDYYLLDVLGDDVPWVLLFYVFMFAYFARSAAHPWGEKKIIRRLCIPFFLYLCFNLIINFDVDLGWYSLPSIGLIQRVVYSTELWLALGMNLILAFLAFRIIRQLQEPRELKAWLHKIWYTTITLLLCWGVLLLIPGWLNNPYHPLDYVLWGGVAAFLFWLCYQGLFRFRLLPDQQRAQAILAGDEPIWEQVEEAPQAVPRPEPKSPPNFQPENPYFQQLEQWMTEEEWYRNPALSRELVATKLGISQGYLSQLVNSITGGHFSAYVNRYRIRSAKQMLRDEAYAAYDLVAIGKEAGFSSKSAFYTAFKKATGMTPKAWQDGGSES
ncbi:MAG: AraC family transcriptional regulator [Bacteroidota bacterium]